MKKLIIIIIILLLTGCSKYTDLEDLAIIKTIGISYDNNKYIIYAHIIDEIDKNKEVKMKIIKSDSDNLDNAIKNIKRQVNKELFMSHIDLLILDYNLKNNEYQNIINYFISSNDFRNDFLCVFSKDMGNVLENSKYDEIEKLLETNQENKNIIYKNFEDIMQEYLDNNSFTLSSITFSNGIIFDGNIVYNKKTERITNEKN